MANLAKFETCFDLSLTSRFFFPLCPQINMEAVTSTDYHSTNLSRNFNQVGFNTYNYSQFDEKYKPRQIFKYGDEYLEYGHRLGANERFARSKHQDGTRFDQRYSRSHSQPERQHHLSQETRSKSQDSRELTFYQIDPPVKLENSRQHDKSHQQKLKKELTFYEIDGPPPIGQERREKPEVCKERGDKGTKSHDKFHAGGQERSQSSAKHGRQEQQKTFENALNRSQSDLTECQLPNYCGHRNNPYIDPPKYRQFDRPPRYQEAPSRSEPPPKYHVDPPKYTEVSRRQDDSKRIQVSHVENSRLFKLELRAHGLFIETLLFDVAVYGLKHRLLKRSTQEFLLRDTLQHILR